MPIDFSMFRSEALIDCLLPNKHWYIDAWRRDATIIPAYMPPYPREDTRPACVVKFGDSILRALGPQHLIWDAYGTDWKTPEAAFTALLKAPIPPWLVKKYTLQEQKNGEMMAVLVPV